MIQIFFIADTGATCNSSSYNYGLYTTSNAYDGDGIIVASGNHIKENLFGKLIGIICWFTYQRISKE